MLTVVLAAFLVLCGGIIAGLLHENHRLVLRVDDLEERAGVYEVALRMAMKEGFTIDVPLRGKR